MQIIVAHQGKPATLIRPLGKNLRQTLYKRLASNGMICDGEGRDPRPVPAQRGRPMVVEGSRWVPAEAAPRPDRPGALAAAAL